MSRSVVRVGNQAGRKVRSRTGRQRRSARTSHEGGTMRDRSDPIALLVEEHSEGLRHLARLQNAVDSIRTVGFSAEAFQDIAEVVRYIDTVVRCHNEKEEKHLFPLLDRHGASPLNLMRGEHRDVWGLLNQLTKTVTDIEDGRLHGTSIRDLLDISQRLIHLLQSCIKSENEILFPIARHVLTGSEYDELRKHIAAGQT